MKLMVKSNISDHFTCCPSLSKSKRVQATSATGKARATGRMDEDAEEFVDACGRGDMRQVAEFLSSHDDVKKHIPEGLFRAIVLGKMEVVDVLLKEDFNINYR